jgi:membrane-associated phospholipid phosphatase
MSAVAAAGRRYLPRGWADLCRQLVIWFGFVLAYQVARGVADRDPARAFANGLRVIGLEQRWTHHLFELSLQRLLDASEVLRTLAVWTYWNSEFTVLSLTLLWVYLRRHDSFARLRNSILLANVIGLVGYVLAPTAPPRMFPSFGFLDTMASGAGINHGSGLVQLAANPYAAMPSLHAADALIVGVVLACVCKRWLPRVLWLLWPAWVWFTIMATANHFLLDVLAGIAVALIALAIVYRRQTRSIIASLL